MGDDPVATAASSGVEKDGQDGEQECTDCYAEEDVSGERVRGNGEEVIEVIVVCFQGRGRGGGHEQGHVAGGWRSVGRLQLGAVGACDGGGVVERGGGRGGGREVQGCGAHVKANYEQIVRLR